MDVPFVVRYCREHHELVNALIDHLREFIQTAEIGQNIRHELDMGCESKKSNFKQGIALHVTIVWIAIRERDGKAS